MTRFILIRHGQTEWNRIDRFRGRADISLDETGLAQAEATGQRVASRWVVSAVYSSPLSRAVNTAKAIAAPFGLTVQVHPGLIDIDFGQWQGMTPAEARQRWPEMVDAWYATPHKAQINGGESLNEVSARLMGVVNELTIRHQGENIGLVGHMVTNRLILLGVLGLGTDRFWHIHQEPCAISVFDAEENDYSLVSLNDTCHLFFAE